MQERYASLEPLTSTPAVVIFLGCRPLKITTENTVPDIRVRRATQKPQTCGYLSPSDYVDQPWSKTSAMSSSLHKLGNVPDTPLVTKAITFAREHSSDSTYNHVLRSVLFGFVIADKVLPNRDREAHAIAAILHDLGFPIGHPPHSTLISIDKRFEVDGANAARDFLKREALPGEWGKHRLQLVWDAIALHTIGSIVFEKEPEVQACAYGIWADFQGPDRVSNGLLSWDEYNPIVKVSYIIPTDHSTRLYFG